MGEIVPKDDGRTPSPSELAEACFAIQPDLKHKIEDVYNILWGVDSDCYGSSYKEEGKPCDCTACCIKEAKRKLLAIWLPTVRSLHPNRLNYAELIYYEAWVKENTRERGLNHGYGLLELILRTPEQVKEDAKRFGNSICGGVTPGFVSQRDMDVATAVVQWFGTNCGRCFIENCEKEAKKRQAERREFEHVTHMRAHWQEHDQKPTYRKIGESIARAFFPGDEKMISDLGSQIVRAMEYARAKEDTTAFERDFAPKPATEEA